MAITNSQRRLLIVVSSLALLRGLFPPDSRRHGFTFFLARADIDEGALMAQAMILLAVTTLLFIWMGGSSPEARAAAEAKRQHRQAKRQHRVEKRKRKAIHQTKLLQLRPRQDAKKQGKDETSGPDSEELDFTGIDPSNTDSSS